MKQNICYPSRELVKELPTRKLNQLIRLIKLRDEAIDKIGNYFAEVFCIYFKNLKPYEVRSVEIFSNMTSEELVNAFYKAFNLYKAKRKSKEIFCKVDLVSSSGANITKFKHTIKITRLSDQEFKRCKTEIIAVN